MWEKIPYSSLFPEFKIWNNKTEPDRTIRFPQIVNELKKKLKKKKKGKSILMDILIKH